MPSGRSKAATPAQVEQVVERQEQKIEEVKTTIRKIKTDIVTNKSANNDRARVFIQYNNKEKRETGGRAVGWEETKLFCSAGRIHR